MQGEFHINFLDSIIKYISNYWFCNKQVFSLPGIQLNSESSVLELSNHTKYSTTAQQTR